MLIEYCDGGAVDSIMVELEKALTEMQIAYICQHMTKGLIFLHKSKVVHRDLKAGNVLLTMAGGVKIGKNLKYVSIIFLLFKLTIYKDFIINYSRFWRICKEQAYSAKT